jgi:hypothetical protein
LRGAGNDWSRMERIVETASGWFLIELQTIANETTVTVARIERDGLVGDKKAWADRWGHHARDETLAEFLVERGIASADAQSLADEIVGSWVERWRESAEGHRAARISRWTGSALYVIFTFLVVAVAAIAYAIWSLAR